MIPTLRLGADDLPVIVVLVVEVSMDRLKNELEPWLFAPPNVFKLLLLLEKIFDEYGSLLFRPVYVIVLIYFGSEKVFNATIY